MEFRREEASLINDIDLYKILKVKKEATSEEIEASFRKLARKYHPDRGGDAEVFSLLQEAYETLSSPKEKKAYDNMRVQARNVGDWYDLKQQSKKNYDTMDYRKASSEEKLNFKQKMKELDEKREYHRDLEDPLSEVEAKKEYERLLSNRSLMDKEKPERLFDSGRFDGALFNELWDKKHGRPGEREIVPRRGAPLAFNDVGGQSFASLEDEQFGDPFVDDDEGGSIYGSKKFGHHEEIKKSDLDGLSGASYYKGHSKIDKNYKKSMKEKLRERQSLTGEVNLMKFDDFSRDDFGGYGIHDKLGFNLSEKLTLDTNEEDIKSRYDKMMQDRNRI